MNGEFGRRPHNPAFEVIFVYSQKEGTLDLNFRGPRKAVEPLQGMFATTILKPDQLPPDPKDERAYDLDQLGKRGFDFSSGWAAVSKTWSCEEVGMTLREMLEASSIEPKEPAQAEEAAEAGDA